MSQPVADYHMHTPLCKHAEGAPWQYAQRAVEVGLTEIGFSEHAPMIRDHYDPWHMDRADVDTYIRDVETAREKFPELTIRIGLEVDFLPGHEAWIEDLAARYDWDYFIGSVHYLDEEWDMDNPYKLDRWRNGDVQAIWRRYYQLLADSVTSDLFDIVGHADLCKKFAFYPDGDPASYAVDFLDTVARCGKAIEINTAGLRKDCKEMYPAPDILRMARERNIPLTMGSDAHAPQEVGMDFDAGLALAKEAGYRETLRFEERCATPVPLA